MLAATLVLLLVPNDAAGQTVRSPGGHPSGGGSGSAVSINLQIADGQGGSFLKGKEEDPKADPKAPEEETEPGAFTVANKNDTDGDGKVDSGDGDVKGELDLMQMKINPHTNAKPDDPVVLAVPGNAKLWKSADKKAGEETARQWKAGQLPITVWVELLEPSSAVRAEAFTLTGGGVSDSVNATGVWAEKDSVFVALPPNPNVAFADLDELRLLNGVLKLGLGTLFFDIGRVHPFTPNVHGIQTGILFQYKVCPHDIGSEKKVVFDFCRQGETYAAALYGGVGPWSPASNRPNIHPNPAEEPYFGAPARFGRKRAYPFPSCP